MSNLTEHAETELRLAGLFGKDSDYDGMLGEAVLELVKVFSKQGHSGFSATQTLHMFNEVASYRPLTPIGVSSEEWVNVTEDSPDDKGLWQNSRRSTTFSRDAGKTWYDIDNSELDNGDSWNTRACAEGSHDNKTGICDWCGKDTGLSVVKETETK